MTSAAALLLGGKIVLPTWNSADKNAAVTLSSDQRTATMTTSVSSRGVRGLVSHSSGKYYFEITLTCSVDDNDGVGIATSALSTSTSFPGQVAGSAGVFSTDTNLRVNGSTNASKVVSASAASGVVFGFCVDLNSNYLYVRTNGSFASGVVPDSSGQVSITAGTYFPCAGFGTSGATAFLNTYGPYNTAAPSGYSSWS